MCYGAKYWKHVLFFTFNVNSEFTHFFAKEEKRPVKCNTKYFDSYKKINSKKINS